MTKPTYTLTRYITPFGSGDAEPYPAIAGFKGGTVSYEVKVTGSLDGLTVEETTVVLGALANSVRTVLISGKQTAEVIARTKARKLPAMRVLMKLADIDAETYLLLMGDDLAE